MYIKMLIILHHESLREKNYSQKLDGYYFQKLQNILGSCDNVALIVLILWTNIENLISFPNDVFQI